MENFSPFYNEKEMDSLNTLLVSSESMGKIGLWGYDTKSGKVWASKGARVILGVDDRELSLDYLKTIPLQEDFAQIVQRFRNMLSQNIISDFEFKIHRLNDNEETCLTTIAKYNKAENSILGLIKDISLQKKIEQEVIKAKKMAEESNLFKSAFISNMSHEIRTPMNGIVGCAHLIAEFDLDQTARNEYKEMIHMCCNQLLETIDDVLDLAHLESRKLDINIGTVTIKSFLEDIYESFLPKAMSKNLKLGLDIDKSSNNLSFQADKIKLNKILKCLLNRAIQNTSFGFVDFGYHPQDESIIFFVRDSGYGTDLSHKESIFQPFKQSDSHISREYKGSGLGLTIAQKYVTMLGGKIWLESKPDSGTTFYFSLPGTKTLTGGSEVPASRSKSEQLKTCLIVDDMEMNFIYLQSLLTPLGFSVLWAKDGEQAIEMSLDHHEIDLVLMDIRLPNTDGYEATRKIKEKRPYLPVIAQTANALPEEEKKARASGCNDYITKPIYKEKIESLINTYFGG